MPTTIRTLVVHIVEKLAEKLEVSPHTIYRYIREGKLQAKRFGNKYQIAQQDLEKFFSVPSGV
ncbi:MAG: helix-turn-helix domain-containing protein [Elusimicrobiota bacterium]|jgi:excisionase family DNA binding protein